MNPWFWIWFSPHLQLPLSGNVTQDIEPVAALFQGRGATGRGKPRLEQQAFHVASYGQQLGLITDVVLALADGRLQEDAHAQESLGRLRQIAARIELLKAAEPDADMAQMGRALTALLELGKTEASQPAEGPHGALPLPTSG